MSNPTDSTELAFKDLLKLINQKDKKSALDIIDKKKKADTDSILQKIDYQITRSKKLKDRIFNQAMITFQKLQKSAYARVNKIIQTGRQQILKEIDAHPDRVKYQARLEKHLQDISKKRQEVNDAVSKGHSSQVGTFLESSKKEFYILEEMDSRFKFTAEWNFDEVEEELQNLLKTKADIQEIKSKNSKKKNEAEEQENKYDNIASSIIKNMLDYYQEHENSKSILAEQQVQQFINPNIIQPIQNSQKLILVNVINRKYSEIRTKVFFPNAMGLLQDGDKLYIVGGQKSKKFLKECYVCFNFLLNIKQIAPLNKAKGNVSLIKLDQYRIASIGGENHQGVSAECQCYYTMSNVWKVCSYKLNLPRTCPFVVSCQDYLCVYGSNHTVGEKILKCAFETGKWQNFSVNGTDNDFKGTQYGFTNSSSKICCVSESYTWYGSIDQFTYIAEGHQCYKKNQKISVLDFMGMACFCNPENPKIMKFLQYEVFPPSWKEIQLQMHEKKN